MQARAKSWVHIACSRASPRLRLVCFPHGGGSAQAYRDWPDELPEWIEVVAIAPPGRGQRVREQAVTDMATMTSAVADALLDLADLPMALFGHSVGALVAFEVAHELAARGLAVPVRLFVSAYDPAPDPIAALEADARPLSQRPDDALLAFLAQIGTSQELERLDEDFRRLVLGAIRADFQLAERHHGDARAPLPIPLTALGGEDDATVATTRLANWRAFTSSTYGEQLFPGGHFYTETARRDLLKLLGATLEDDLDRLPKSLLFGASEAYPLDTCLHELFRQQAARTPEAVALVGRAG